MNDRAAPRAVPSSRPEKMKRDQQPLRGHDVEL